MKLSVVTTVYNSADTIEAFCDRALAAAEKLTSDIELVIVDDGSPDNSLELAIARTAVDSRVRVIELSRNFGHHKALMTGIEHATGDLVLLIDSDLEEDPALLGQFVAVMQQTAADVVYGVQEQRKGGWIERFTGALAFRIFELLIPYKIPRNHVTMRLMRRDYASALLQHREQATVIGGLWVITGFHQIAVQINKASRRHSSYSFWRRWLMFVESITSFSEKPLVVIFYLGLTISGIALLVAIWLLVQRMMLGALLEGWVSVMLSVWFLGGLLIFCVGLIGIYVSKIFIETKNRPYVIVRRIHQSPLGGSDKPLEPRAADVSITD